MYAYDRTAAAAAVAATATAAATAAATTADAAAATAAATAAVCTHIIVLTRTTEAALARRSLAVGQVPRYAMLTLVTALVDAGWNSLNSLPISDFEIT